MDLWRLVWFIVAIILLAFLIFGCESPPPPVMDEVPVNNICEPLRGEDRPDWLNGHAVNSLDMGCL